MIRFQLQKTDLCFENCFHDDLVSGALGGQGPAPGVGAELVGLLALDPHGLLVPVQTTVTS
jgi:hypothetical protein